MSIISSTTYLNAGLRAVAALELTVTPPSVIPLAVIKTDAMPLLKYQQCPIAIILNGYRYYLRTAGRVVDIHYIACLIEGVKHQWN